MKPTANRRPRRSRKTRLAVRVSEHLARLLITIGGIGTIGAVTLIFVFLVMVVLPLFSGAEVSERAGFDASDPDAIHVLVDEYGVLVANLDADGTVHVRSLDTGEVVDTLDPFDDAGTGAPTAMSASPKGESLVFGFRDGTIRIAHAGFTPSFPEIDEIPVDLRTLGPGEAAPHRGGILRLTPEGKFRLQRFSFELGEPFAPSHSGAEQEGSVAIVRLGHVAGDDHAVVCAWTADARLYLLQTSEQLNFLTGESEIAVEETILPYEPDRERGPPDRVFLTSIGDNVLLIWKDGRLERLDVREPSEASIAEVVDVAPEEGDELSAATLLIGNSTLVTGTSGGRIRAWFRTKPEVTDTRDGILFVAGHELLREGPAVTALAPSPRSRLLAAGFADGSAQLFHVTTARSLAEIRMDELGRVHALRLMPKEDGLVALGERGLGRWDVEAHHPEASLSAFFAPVWYESHPEPQHVWQSESATDDFEPKFGFMPLVYGTCKATFYSMIFGAPLALLAAIFTSEFLDRRLRVPIKSSIEMMASLPSVVLGFLAGIVIAPFAQTIIPATLAIFATLPIALLAGAYIWQLLPQRSAIRWSGWPRLVCISVALPIGCAGALVLGPWIERVFFAGDIELWLDGQRGSAVGGWMLILLPAAAFVVAVGGGRVLGPWIRARSAQWSRARCAVADVIKFAGGALLTVAIALAASWALELVGLDPRGSFVDTYVQRNALIVGFVMGFAVIPIIYTLAEDALNSVPEHLRHASLGAGATPWQTAVRVIVPTAMSGLFSAVMIGLGRAVGETMIVLMATGNTPVMEANIFNGFRTLSANIAVELPEAVQNSTHYRTLFLAALVLFAMTFVLNTVAEAVRQRFRKRAYQL